VNPGLAGALEIFDAAFDLDPARLVVGAPFAVWAMQFEAR
jgi:hypothetical protein